LAKAEPARRNQVRNAFVAPLSVALGQITNSLRAQPVTLETLPHNLLDAWETSDGHFRIQAAPKGDPNDNETLRKFAAAVLAAEPSAINGPISILEAGHTISFAFIEAGGWALLSIAILLWIVLRRFTDALMTLV